MRRDGSRGLAARGLALGLVVMAGLARGGGMPVRAEPMASIVIDAATGQVLEQADATRPWHPASLAKLMTVYLAFAAIEAGRMTLDDVLTVSPTAAALPETRLGLREGKAIAVEQAIKAVIVRSANDAAVLLSERIGGNEKAFAAMMTAKARELGMTRTVFRNATGLPEDGQMTTARDMALLARALLRDFPQHYRIFSASSIQWGGQTLSTYNGLLGAYQGADGLKTGFTCASGYNLVGSAMRGDRRLIGVVLGGRTSAERNDEMVKLLDTGFRVAAASDLPLVDGLADGDDGPAPQQLSAAECSTLPLAAGIGNGGRLPGWAVIFGAFPDQGRARQAVEQARKALQSVLKRGQPAIIRRQQEGVYGWAALLVGLEQKEAGAACKQLWSKGAYCLALNPDVLNSPAALWR